MCGFNGFGFGRGCGCNRGFGGFNNGFGGGCGCNDFGGGRNRGGRECGGEGGRFDKHHCKCTKCCKCERHHHFVDRDNFCFEEEM